MSRTSYLPKLTIEKVLTDYTIETSVLIHVGAHLVQEAEIYNAHKFEKVIWVEAFPPVYDLAREKLEKYNNQTILQAVCWSQPEVEIPFHVSKGQFSSSALDMKWHKIFWPGSGMVETLNIKSTTLDIISKSESSISVLNIDVQGAELEVLKGGIATLTKCEYIFLEISLRELYKNQPLFHDIHNFLTLKNFQLLDYEINPETGDGSSLYANRDKVKAHSKDIDLKQLNVNFKINKAEILSRWVDYLKFRSVLFIRNLWRKIRGKEIVPN